MKEINFDLDGVEKEVEKVYTRVATARGTRYSTEQRKDSERRNYH